MSPMNYCCCAIPLVNAGIYAVLIEQFIIATVAGALSLATPPIVGAVVFSSAPIIFAIVCFVAAVIQILGVVGVAMEKPTLFKRYIALHSLITSGVFGVAITWTVISATRHSTALSRCKEKFFEEPIPADGQSRVSGVGERLCDIFPWVSIGLMGGLIVLLAILHLYFFFVLAAYSRQQRDDHFKYNSVYNPLSAPVADNIAMGTTDYGKERGLSHRTQESATSMSDVLSQPTQTPKDSLGYSYGRFEADPYSASSSYRNVNENTTSPPPTHPANAYTEEPRPTPIYPNPHYAYDDDNGSGLHRPAQSQSHPAEGSFGRKAPRLVSPYGPSHY